MHRTILGAILALPAAALAQTNITFDFYPGPDGVLGTPDDIPIVAPTPRVETYRQLALVWGVVAVRSRDAESTEQLLLEARRAAVGMVAFEPSDVVVVTAGVPLGVPGATNLIKVETPARAEHDASLTGARPRSRNSRKQWKA